MRKQRAPDLTDERSALVVEVLDGWSGKLTWDLLIDEVHRRINITYSRFTLAQHPRISAAFALRKDLLRGKFSNEPRLPKDERVREALEKAAREKAKAERLEMENKLLLEQFVTWAINAERRGVTIDMLNAPVPRPHREQSKVRK